MLEVQGLSKSFYGTPAVEDVTFRVETGEILGFLGPNGAGKTTTMRMITGFLPPTAGRVLLADVDVTQKPLLAKRELGYLPETLALYPEMRVREYVAFRAELCGVPSSEKKARVDDAIQKCFVDDVATKPIGNLSKGYRQRVGLAGALVHKPKVLVLDEPTVGLDPRQVVEMRAMVRALRGHTTVLLSTHILSEVATVCDRVVIIDRGRLVAEDTADALARAEQRAQRLLVRVAAPPAEVAAALMGLAELSAVEPQPSDDGTAHLIATVRPGAAAASAVAAAVLRRHWRLEEIRVLTPSLEELFVRLTGGEAAP
jgi:ABC-2 type transport system ATP-binding protein